MKVLFATTNPAKIEYYAKELKRRSVEVVTLQELGITLDVKEDGKNGVENAMIKAKAYAKVSNMPTIAIDDTLFIEGIKEEEQPGTNVRRVHGKRLSDDEMLEYYTNLVKKYGGKLQAKWIKGVAVWVNDEMKTLEYSRDHFFFIDEPSKQRHDGYPLDSIAIIPRFEKYLSELTEEEMREYRQEGTNQKIFDFIINTLENT